MGHGSQWAADRVVQVVWHPEMPPRAAQRPSRQLQEASRRLSDTYDDEDKRQAHFLERFGPANEGGKISALANNEELDDYTFRVAGCVGVFWTKMSLAHLMDLSPEDEKVFMERGIRFGKALQMINILRDIPEDLRFGRCYLPQDMLEKHGLTPEDLLDDGNLEVFRPLYDTYLDLTNEHLEAATAYIQMIPETQFRLKASCMLPVLVGQRTVTLLREGNILNSDERIKVTRDEMKTYARKLLRALLIPGGVRRLLEKNRDK